jgi:hypothetical protein
MQLSFRSTHVDTSRGKRTVLFVEVPGLHRPVETGAVAMSSNVGEFCAAIEDEVERRRPKAVVITDPVEVDAGEWASARGAAYEQRAAERARGLVDAMSRLYRRVAAMGAAPIIHAGLSDAASTLRMASTALCGEARAEESESATGTSWVLRHAVFFVALSERGVRERVLPRHFESAALGRRRSLDMIDLLRRIEGVG